MWTLSVIVLVIVVYYVAPFTADRSLPVRSLIGVVALGFLGVVSIRQLRHTDDPVGRLVTLLVVVVVTFSAVFFGLSRVPGQFAGIVTRTDALYFTVVTLSTIGYGDVHPVGQVARLVVVLAIGFNLVIVAAIVSAIASRLPEPHHHDTSAPAPSTAAPPDGPGDPAAPGAPDQGSAPIED